MTWTSGAAGALAGVDPVVAGGAASIVGLLVTVFGYLLKELHRKDDSVWRIVREERALRLKAEADAAHWMQLYLQARGIEGPDRDV